MKDIRDANLNIAIMSRDTDSDFKFTYTHPDGSTFVWSQYTAVCEGRYAIAHMTPDFSFPVSYVTLNDVNYIQVDFPKAIVNGHVRETRLYWKVLATHNTTGKTIELGYGEVWLK